MQADLFEKHEYHHTGKKVVNDPESFQVMMNFLEDRKEVAFDFETSGLNWFQGAEAIGIGLGAYNDKDRAQCYYVPFRHATGEVQMDLEVVGPAIKTVLENPATLKIAHNLKFDAHMARREGWDVAGPYYDTFIAARLFDDNRPLDLKTRAQVDLKRGARAHKYEAKVQDYNYRAARDKRITITDFKAKYGYSLLPVGLCGTYCAFDIDYTLGLKRFYESHDLSSTYGRIWSTEMDLVRVLGDMEAVGIPVDVEYLEKLKETLGRAKEELERAIKHKLGGRMFALGSDQACRNFLQNDLQLPLTKKTKGKQFSVDKEVLSSFSAAHPVLLDIMKWRDADILDTSFTDTILSRLDENNLLHADYNQVGTNSGRLSCSKPNFQNQPSDDDARARAFSGLKLEDGGVDPWSIRRAYVNRGPGWVRLYFDYSQVELRVLAYYSQDPVMVQAYLNGEDVHSRTSLEVFGTAEKAMRRLAKIINFGLSYGMQEHGFSAQAKIPLAQAKEFLDIFWSRYAVLKKFRSAFWDRVRDQGGYFQNIFGRPRRILQISNPDEFVRGGAERRAIATLIQGTAAELTKESLVRTWHFLKERDLEAYLVATVHDENQIDTKVDHLVEISRAVKQLMEDFPEFQPIPIVVDGEYSTTNWAEKKTLPLAA